MKINLDFYKEKEKINNDYIADLILNNDLKDYSEIMQKSDSIKVINALSDIRRNIISWYPFKKNASILEINANYGEITQELCIKFSKVTSVERSLEKARTISKRLDKYENIDIIVGDLKDIVFDTKFDYVLINGIEENRYSLDKYLDFSKLYLNNNGVILFTCDNKFGLKTYNFNSQIDEENKCLSKKEIENYLKKYGYKKYKFYYPLPNYKLPNVIFSDKHLPNCETILRDTTIFDKYEIIACDERKRYQQIINEDSLLFPFFANSYLVEVSNKDNNIEFVTFSNSRKEKYRVKTVIFDDIVHKEVGNEKGSQHFYGIIENIKILKKLNVEMLDSFDENIIYSIRIKQEPLDKILIEKFENGQKEEAIALIDEFIKEISNKLQINCDEKENNIFEKYNIKIEEELNEKMTYIKYGFFDLIFQNCFYIDNKFYFYDQEWMEENIPLEFIIFRAIYYLANSKDEIDRIDLYERFGITPFLGVFENLEMILQQKIKDKFIWEIHMNNKTTIKKLWDTKVHYRNLKTIAEQSIIAQKEEYNRIILEKDEIIKKLSEELESIKSLKYYKIIQKFKNGLNRNKEERKDI